MLELIGGRIREARVSDCHGGGALDRFRVLGLLYCSDMKSVLRLYCFKFRWMLGLRTRITVLWVELGVTGWPRSWVFEIAEALYRVSML